MDVDRLVLASGNEGKVREFQKIFWSLGLKWLGRQIWGSQHLKSHSLHF